MGQEGRQQIDEERLQLALDAAGLDLWENDLASGAITRRATRVFSELGYSEDEAARLIRPGTWFLDLNSCSPGTKWRASERIDAAGGSYV